MATVTIRPVSDTVLSQNTPVGATNHYDCVDEVSSDADSTYLSDNGMGQYTDLFTFQSTGIGAGATINSVTLYHVSKTTATNRLYVYTAKRVFYVASTAYVYGGNVTTSYATYSTILTTNPNTGVAWTLSEVDSLIAGVEHTASSTEVRTTQVYAVIDYTGGASTPTTDAIMFGTS